MADRMLVFNADRIRADRRRRLAPVTLGGLTRAARDVLLTPVALASVAAGIIAAVAMKAAVLPSAMAATLGSLLSAGAQHLRGRSVPELLALLERKDFAVSPLLLPDTACLAGVYRCPACARVSQAAYACDRCDVEWLFFDNHRGFIEPYDAARLPAADAARRFPPPGVSTMVLGGDARFTLMVWRAGTDPFQPAGRAAPCAMVETRN